MAVSLVEESISVNIENRTRQYNKYYEFKFEIINGSSRGVNMKFTLEMKIHTKGTKVSKVELQEMGFFS